LLSAAPLNFLSISHYEPLVASSVRHLLPRVSPHGRTFGVGAALGGVPAGVAIGVAQQTNLEIAWLYVLASKRRRGVGRALLGALEAWASERSLVRASIAYPTTPHVVEPVQSFLWRCGFTTDATTIVSAGISAELAASPWHLQLKVPDSLQIVRWIDLSSSQRRELSASLTSEPGHLQNALSPFSCEEGLDADTSLALCRAGDVIGWVMTHPAGPTTLHYSALAVREKFRGSGYGIALIAHAFRHQVRVQGPACIGAISVSTQNTVIMRLLEGPMKPYVAWSAHAAIARKALG
jgi:GNAT superfamily N-acetyltransferase